ncbi:S-DNA-T family DNA segregation ATPase FtsK/SpoIIIE [Microbacterium sp. AK009]|uniref:FtsK/SpoIIIE domain-containing protein n=1 Tax=Microbacterium sp. AK009 TaxID=2723068 RepID=UPI0015C8A895|nr:FtsK/SpoIIIE domain-containing protein [Microbacterium sp. AK009]NYF15971.1 S-DNA-T family DNA segregation ATPase FtsK/SpoIIIE [Microbacterium sp. AK009]
MSPFTPLPPALPSTSEPQARSSRRVRAADDHPLSSGLPEDPAPDELLHLEDGWERPPRPPLPIVASTVPILGAGALWLVTGSILALWLAALGPLIAIASIADAARSARRDRRDAERVAARTRADVTRAVASRHRRERERWWAVHPDVARLAGSDVEVWRTHRDRGDTVVVGRGRIPSAVRVTGGRGDPSAGELRRRAAILEDAPIAVPLNAGIAVIGPPLVSAAVARALVLQACLLHPPGSFSVLVSASDDEDWLARLPHRRVAAARTLALRAGGADAADAADIRIVRVDPGEPPPPGCAVVLRVDDPDRAHADIGGETYEIRTEAVGRAQAASIADDLALRAGRSWGELGGDDRPVLLADLLAGDGRSPVAGGGLLATIGRDRAPVSVDLVEDGPHAVVTGMTGSGKSELLVTWVLALCARYSTREVTFLLADFKGGTAFQRLAGLPHVTGVITDLDPGGARRAIESLRAEIRWRESELARTGARDIRDDRAELPRLVVVVDEFAALLADHPELQALFTDLAARGRALGMHLILGTQRTTGVIREGLWANLPLRLSLRVADAADSRAVLGTDDAAGPVSGGTERGTAWLRRSIDAAPRRFRVALAGAADVAAVGHGAHGPTPRRSWLPALPARVDLADLRVPAADDGAATPLILGLLDEPDQQRQRPALLERRTAGVVVLGRSGSGRTTALQTLGAQRPDSATWVPADPEAAWDLVHGLVRAPRPGPASPRLILIDDVDALAGRYPMDYAGEFLQRLEDLLRGAAGEGAVVALTAQRLTGGVARLLDLAPQRVLLATASRADHVALGGDPAGWEAHAVPGRGTIDGIAVQVATAWDAAVPGPTEPPETWRPRALAGFVTRRSPQARAALRAWEEAGAALIDLDAFDAGVERGSRSGQVVVVGEPDEWQRHWRTLALIRSDHDLVIDASCGPEYRMLTADRDLPPYCLTGRGRAWVRQGGGAPRRILLPDTPAHA